MPIDRATIDRAIAELAQAVPASVITDTLPGTRVAIAFKALFATSGDIDAARAYIIGDQRASPIWEHRHDSLLLSESATPSAGACGATVATRRVAMRARRRLRAVTCVTAARRYFIVVRRRWAGGVADCLDRYCLKSAFTPWQRNVRATVAEGGGGGSSSGRGRTSFV